MMYPRLVLLKQFLSEDGAIFISIDDNEVADLRLIMDEIFGKRNFIATVIWQKIFSPKNSARHLSEDHDYVTIYASDSDAWKPQLLPRNEDAKSRYKNTDGDKRGPWTSGDLQARNFYSEGTYPVTCPSGRVISGPGKGMYWRVSKQNFAKLEQDNRIWWGPEGNNMPRMKRFLSEVKSGVVPQTIWFHKDVGHTQEAKKELLELVDFETSKDVFITPKPTRLIQRILKIATDKDSIVLDSFSGSGTTAHAVLKQNAEDGGNRKFILVEMDEKIARNVTAERVRRVAHGYTNTKGKAVEGLGGGFQFCKLSEAPLFNADGAVRGDVTFEQLAEFVWFVETGSGRDADPRPNPSASAPGFALPPASMQSSPGGRGARKVLSPLLGVYEGRAVYLLYNGILKDKSVNGGNVLTGPVLESLPAHDGPKVIYAAACRLGPPRLRREGIEFKQTPYALEV